MPALWRNWAGDQRCAPELIMRPRTERELARIVAGASRVRAVGAGHSFSDIAATSGAVSATSGRNAKIELLASALRRLDPGEAPAHRTSWGQRLVRGARRETLFVAGVRPASSSARS